MGREVQVGSPLGLYWRSRGRRDSSLLLSRGGSSSALTGLHWYFLLGGVGVPQYCTSGGLCWHHWCGSGGRRGCMAPLLLGGGKSPHSPTDLPWPPQWGEGSMSYCCQRGVKIQAPQVTTERWALRSHLGYRHSPGNEQLVTTEMEKGLLDVKRQVSAVRNSTPMLLALRPLVYKPKSN